MEHPHFRQTFFHEKPEAVDRKTLLFIDGRDFQSKFAYKIYFDREGNNNQNVVSVDSFKNVKQVELKALTFPKIPDEHYVILTFDELSDNIQSTDNAGSHRSSCVCFFDRDSMQPGDKKTIFPIEGKARTMVCNPPLKSLSQLTVKFTKYGSDKPIETTDFPEGLDLSHSMLLEITTCH